MPRKCTEDGGEEDKSLRLENYIKTDLEKVGKNGKQQQKVEGIGNC